MARAKVINLTFRLREVLPPDHPISVPLLRLMAATNDVRQLMTLLLKQEDKGIGLSPAQLIQNGEVGYLVRMLCGHLYEAGIAFRDLDAKCGCEIDRLLAGEPNAQEALAHLRKVYGNESARLIDKILEKIRNLLAFHYKHVPFERALTKHEEEGALVIAEYAGMSRYAITDSFLTRLTVEELGGSMERFIEIHQEAIRLSSSLALAVDHLLLRLLQQHQRAILNRTEDVLEVSPEVQSTRERIERARSENGGPTGGVADRRGTFLATARSLNLTGPPDWSERLDDYLYGASGNAG